MIIEVKKMASFLMSFPDMPGAAVKLQASSQIPHVIINAFEDVRKTSKPYRKGVAL